MSQDTPYISPEYNPHSLTRDWGFLLFPCSGDVFARSCNDLTGLRANLYQSLVQRTLTSEATPPSIPDQPAKVRTDGLSTNGNGLLEEVGLDILTLTLLADVPIHRPLHLTQNNLIGHWRWLREVWRDCASRRTLHSASHEDLIQSPVTRALQNGKNNLAIAELRSQFKKVQHAPDDARLYLSFLDALTLFCPFIGTELLWRQGRIDRDPLSKSGTRDKYKEGIIE